MCKKSKFSFKKTHIVNESLSFLWFLFNGMNFGISANENWNKRKYLLWIVSVNMNQEREMKMLDFRTSILTKLWWKFFVQESAIAFGAIGLPTIWINFSRCYISRRCSVFRRSIIKIAVQIVLLILFKLKTYLSTVAAQNRIN